MSHCMDSEKLHARMKTIIGQLQVVERMIDDDTPCEDVLTQISAAKSALNKVGQLVRWRALWSTTSVRSPSS